ncbi:ATP-binding cassette domain-containing protein [Roseibium porphyridii]|uniref:ATP-binding cassette domain-containing protein n=1 Tax=Roseibium porphyridii TaxID=2866279 RepID=A0ABY8F673_9HYPH|nr:ATP-binding cassette domain-containing protein [Roseibium sp. KMA01]WFE90982.1 ATP-binding cassette domain-containing protein [Roseibium sp. KMA01]
MRDLEFHSAVGSIAPPRPQEPLLETKGLSFSAGGDRLLRDISLEIRPGSRTLIMGPNGAGKSLLLRLMHGLLRPETGNILWNGAKLTAEARRSQAMVFQRPVLLRRSVFANLKFALSVRGLNGRIRSEKIEQALAIAGLSHLAKRPARVLSGGEQQRLAVVRALACEPDLLFLDEPTANLDPASTAAIEQLVLEANTRGVTIVMVTHDAGQAKRVGEDLIFLQDGKIAETGDVQQVLSAPKSEPVRAWRDGRIYLGANIETMSEKSGRKA